MVLQPPRAEEWRLQQLGAAVAALWELWPQRARGPGQPQLLRKEVAERLPRLAPPQATVQPAAQQAAAEAPVGAEEEVVAAAER